MLTQPLPKGEMPSNNSQTSGRDNEAVLGSEENNCEQVTALSVGGELYLVSSIQILKNVLRFILI